MKSINALWSLMYLVGITDLLAAQFTSFSTFIAYPSNLIPFPRL